MRTTPDHTFFPFAFSTKITTISSLIGKKCGTYIHTVVVTFNSINQYINGSDRS